MNDKFESTTQISMKTNNQKIEYVKDTFEEYLSKSDFVSASDLKNFLKSPRYYYYEKFEKIEDPTKKKGRHFQIGSALHENVMEPEIFNTNYMIVPKVDKRTTKGKEDWAKFEAESEGKVLITDEEMDMIKEMTKNAKKHRTFMELMSGANFEVSCYTIDEKTGLKIRLRPDVLCARPIIVDIKSCVESSPRDFRGDMFSYKYNLSAAFYMDFLNFESYLFFALEKQKPNQASLFGLSDELMDAGRKQYRMGLDLLAWCQKNNHYPDYSEFEVLKECYELGHLDQYFETIEQSELIIIIK